MNSNRMKYASTPTYGMQKRNYAKKQAAAQATPTPDFTQQPSMDGNTPLTPFPAQNPFMMPQGSLAAQPSANPLFSQNPLSNPTMGVSPGMPSGIGNSSPFGAYPGFIPQQQQQNTILTYHPPIVSQAPQNFSGMFSPHTQGFAPPSYNNSANGMPQAYQNAGNTIPQGYTNQSNAMPPNVLRSDAMSGFGSYTNQAYSNPAMMPGIQNGAMGNGYSPNGYPNGNSYGGQPQNNLNNGYPSGSMNMQGGPSNFQRMPYTNMEGGAPATPTPKPPLDIDKWLKIILYGVLPVLFIPCLFVTHTFDFIRYLFIITTVISLSVLWYRQSFSSGLRTTLSVVYLTLSIVVIAMLISGNKDVQQNANLGANAAGQVTTEPTSTLEAAPLAAADTPAPNEDPGESEAEQRLTTFMDYWSQNRVEDMVNLVQPSWVSTQDSPAQALFTVVSNRTPQEYTLEGVSGVATDSSRTITMSAYIDKNNGKDPVRYRFMILMVKESGDWYVDPNSLATNDAEATVEPTVSGKETISQSLAPRMTVTPIPDPSTKLYYNADGGNYYHADPNCSAVNPKFLPMASFLYSELDDPPYSSLSPCLKCGAPTQSLGSIASEATATPAP